MRGSPSRMRFSSNRLAGVSQIAPFFYPVQAEFHAEELEATFRMAAACIEPHITGLNDCMLGFTTDVTTACVNELTALRYTPYSEVDIETRECITDMGYQFREAIIHAAQFFRVPAECHPFHHEAFFPFKCAPTLTLPTGFVLFYLLSSFVCFRVPAECHPPLLPLQLGRLLVDFAVL